MTEVRTYSSLATAKKALRTFELSHMLVRFDTFEPARNSKKFIRPVILCDEQVERRRVEEHGFAAELKQKDYCIGATVSLHPTVPAERHDGLAVIAHWLKQTAEGAVLLDRPLGGTKYWNIDSLVLV